jgi:hypothetical protein
MDDHWLTIGGASTGAIGQFWKCAFIINIIIMIACPIFVAAVAVAVEQAVMVPTTRTTTLLLLLLLVVLQVEFLRLIGDSSPIRMLAKTSI